MQDARETRQAGRCATQSRPTNVAPDLRAPQAALFASLTQGFFGDGTLPQNMLIVGAGIGVAIIVADTFLQRSSTKMRLHIMPIAFGIYLPLALSAPIFIGGLLRAPTPLLGTL